MIEILTSLDRNPAEFSCQAIDSAEQNITALVYKFTDPSILEALNQALLRGVQVHLLIDGHEAFSANSLADQLSAMGADIRLFGETGAKLHAKFMVIDHHQVYTGSSNWTRSARKSNMELLLKLDGAHHANQFLKIFDHLRDAGTMYPDEGHRYVNGS